jgi:hypothetical protein
VTEAVLQAFQRLDVSVGTFARVQRLEEFSGIAKLLKRDPKFVPLRGRQLLELAAALEGLPLTMCQ